LETDSEKSIDQLKIIDSNNQSLKLINSKLVIEADNSLNSVAKKPITLQQSCLNQSISSDLTEVELENILPQLKTIGMIENLTLSVNGTLSHEPDDFSYYDLDTLKSFARNGHTQAKIYLGVHLMWAAVHNGLRYPLAEDDFLLLDEDFRKILDVEMLNERRHWLNEALIGGAIYSTDYLSKSYKLEADWLVFYEQEIAKQESLLLKSNDYRHVWKRIIKQFVT